MTINPEPLSSAERIVGLRAEIDQMEAALVVIRKNLAKTRHRHQFGKPGPTAAERIKLVEMSQQADDYERRLTVSSNELEALAKRA